MLLDETLLELDAMRVEVQDFFDDEKLSAKRIIEIETNILPARVLTYQYYGSSELAPQIIGLNSDINVSFYEGTKEILTV